VLVHTLSFFVILFGVAAMLMTFPGAKQIGASLLASAGLAGLAVGFAAKPVLGNLIAGLQIAITQPLSLDDVVIVENEWGRIEEITSTYVVIKIWDERRLIVPLQYFIENPFQNWTRESTQLLGSLFLWVDYAMPLDPLRNELERLCKQNLELWDGRVSNIQVTDTSYAFWLAPATPATVGICAACCVKNWCNLLPLTIRIIYRNCALIILKTQQLSTFNQLKKIVIALRQPIKHCDCLYAKIRGAV
jgi:hypothetical protein